MTTKDAIKTVKVIRKLLIMQRTSTNGALEGFFKPEEVELLVETLKKCLNRINT